MDSILDLQLLEADTGAGIGVETGYTSCSATSCSFAIMDGFTGE